MSSLSPRLAAIVDALPLRPGMRVLEIGGGPGAAARAIAAVVGDRGHVVMIDRSATAIGQAEAACRDEIAAGRLSVRRVAVEDFQLLAGEAPFDLALAVRVGALDGRHPAAGVAARCRLAAEATLRLNGALFIDGGTPLREISLDAERAGGRLVSVERLPGQPLR